MLFAPKWITKLSVQTEKAAKCVLNSHINRLASLKGRPNTPENMLYIITNSNPGKEQKIKKVLAEPIYIQNPVNGRFWPNLDFTKAGSQTAGNFKFCVKHDRWSARPPSKFQVKIIFLG